MKALASDAILLLFLTSLLAGSCDIINPEEAIPAYLYVPAFELQTDPTTEGSNAQKITDVWVTVDGAFLGAYPLPANIPVLTMGTTNIILEAGVKENGFNATPNIYPFYEQFEIALELTPGQTDTLSPIIGYREATQFTVIEEFEAGNTVFQAVLDGAGQLMTTMEDTFEGERSGRIFLTASDPVLEVVSQDKYTAASFRGNNTTEVWLEVNYKSDVPVAWGFIGNQPGVVAQFDRLYDPVFNAKPTWNKIYFNLSSLLFQGNYETYQLALLASIPIENGGFSRAEATVLLDNIKLVHF